MMEINMPSNEEKYLKWLSTEVSPSKVNDYYFDYREIEEYCLKKKIIKKPLLETTDIETVLKVKDTVERSKVFRFSHKKDKYKLVKAIGYYYRFIKDEQAMILETTKNSDSFKNKSKIMNKYNIDKSYPDLDLKKKDNFINEKQSIDVEKVHNIADRDEIEEKVDKSSGIFENKDKINTCEDELETTGNFNMKQNVDAGESEIDSVRVVDFRNSVSYAYTCPVQYTYFEEIYDNFSSWIDMYVDFVNALSEDYDWIIESLEGKSISGENGRIDIGSRSNKGVMIAPKELSNGLYLETDFSVYDIIEKIKCFLDLCNVDYENVVILYKHTKKNILVTNSDMPTNIKIWNINVDSGVKDIERLKLYHNILTEKYPKGFRIDSRIDMRRFRGFWEQKYGKELDETDDEVCDNIKKITIRYQNFALLPETLLSERNKIKLLSYINQLFSQGKQVVYYRALYEEMSMVWCESRINNPDMLKAYLSYVNEGQYYMERSYLSQGRYVEFDPVDEVRNYLLQLGVPVKTDELCGALSHIPRREIELALCKNNEFIRNAKSEYFHPDAVVIDEDELEGISNIIRVEIDDKYFISGNELMEVVKIKYLHVFERQPQFSDFGMRSAIGYKLKDKYSFNGNIISEKGKNLSMYDVYAKYCKKRRYITLEELKTLKKTLNTTIYFDAVYDNSLRINKNEFVSKDLANFDVKRIDEAIDRFCKGNYIAIKDIEFFGSFPDVGFSWNSYLLEHYVACYSKKYRLIHTNFNESSCVGAIVRNTANIEDFNALVVDVISNGNIVLESDTALNYLCERGFMARRLYKGIDQVLIQAKVIREKRG